jgi:hypothetical protein
LYQAASGKARAAPDKDASKKEASYWNPKGSTWTDEVTLPTRSSPWSNNGTPGNSTALTIPIARAPREPKPAKELEVVEFTDFTVDFTPDKLLQSILDDQRSQTDSFTIIPEETFKLGTPDEIRKAAIKKVMENLEKQLDQALAKNIEQRRETMKFMATMPDPRPTMDLLYDLKWQHDIKLLKDFRRGWDEVDIILAGYMRTRSRDFVRKVMNDTEAVKHRGLERWHAVKVQEARSAASIRQIEEVQATVYDGRVH